MNRVQDMLRPTPSWRYAIGRAVAARRFSSSSSGGNSTREEAKSSRRGGIGAAGALLAALAAADVAYPHYQQAEADRRAAAALLKGGAALAVSPSATALAIAGGGGSHHGGVGNGPAATPIPITIESASQHVKVVVVDKGHGNDNWNGHGHGGSGRLVSREALRRRVQGALAPRAVGRGGYVVVTGPKGSGKSAVVREATLAQGAHVLYIDLTDPASNADAEAAVRRALGLDGLPVHPPYQSLLGLAYGAALRGLGGKAQGQNGNGEDEAVASVRRALRLLQRALVKAQQNRASNSGGTAPPPTIVFDHLEALTPEAAAAVQDWAQGVTATEQPPLASTVALVAGEGTSALATLMGRPAWAGVAGQVEVPDLTDAEALAFLKQACPHLRTGDARRLVALLGGRLVHLRRAVSGLHAAQEQHQHQHQQAQSGSSGGEKARAGIEDVALEACEGMRSGYDRLMSLPPAAFLPPSTTTITGHAAASSASSSTCCRHRIPGWSASVSASSQPPAMHALLAALLHAPTKTLPLPIAAAKLQPASATNTTDAETGLAHRLLSEHGPVLALLPPAQAGDPPRVGFASPLAEKFGHAYLSTYTRAAAGAPSAEQVVVAALAAEMAGADDDDDEEEEGGVGNGKRRRKGGFPRLVSTALLAASAALYLAATATGGGRGDSTGGNVGGYRGIYLALPQPTDIEALTRAAQQALRTSTAITADAAHAVAGKLAAASYALGEMLAAAAAAAASHAAANTPLKGRRDGGGGGSTQL